MGRVLAVYLHGKLVPGGELRTKDLPDYRFLVVLFGMQITTVYSDLKEKLPRFSF